MERRSASSLTVGAALATCLLPNSKWVVLAHLLAPAAGGFIGE